MAAAAFGKIGVLYGGVSSEREISLRSGKAVYDALKQSGLDAELIDIQSTERRVIMDQLRAARVELAFIALHGRFGEDGGIQAMFDEEGVMYTGSGAAASRIAFNKAETQRFLRGRDIPVAPFAVLNKTADNDWAKALAAVGGFPVVVKPACEGSSIGVSVAAEAAGFERAVSAAFTFGDTVVVEKFIAGRELTVGIVADEVLPVIEIFPKSPFFDFEAKYQSGLTEYRVPADIGAELTAGVQQAALQACKAIGCESLARVDFMAQGPQAFYVLEINNIPGFTSTSLVPKAAKAAGVEFPVLCRKIVEYTYGKKKAKFRSPAVSG